MIFVFSIFIAVVTALTNIDGPCPTVYPVNNFNFTAYTNGKWFEIARYHNSWTDQADCVTIEYSYIAQCCATGFSVSAIKNGKRRFIEGITPIPTNPGAGTVSHITDDIRDTEEFTELPVSVLDTDYKNYAITYFCQYNEYTNKRTEFSWIQSRYPSLTYHVEKYIDRFLKYSDVIDPKKLIWSGFTRQTC